MFSFFEYLRRRTCDSIIAGTYDAMEMIAHQPVEEPVEVAGEKIPLPANPKPPDKVEPPKKIAAAPSPASTPPTDLFSPISRNEGEPPLPSRKRGRPPKNPPQLPSQQ